MTVTSVFPAAAILTGGGGGVGGGGGGGTGMGSGMGGGMGVGVPQLMRVTGVGYNATDGHITTTSEKEMTGIAVGTAEHPGAARVLVTGAICNNASVRVNVTEEEVKEGRMGSTTDGRVIPGGLGRTEHGVTVRNNLLTTYQQPINTHKTT